MYIRLQGYGGGEAFKGLSTDWLSHLPGLCDRRGIFWS